MSCFWQWIVGLATRRRAILLRAQVHITWIQFRSCPDLPCDVMRTLFLSLCVWAAAEECANCEPPVQSAALLQSSAHRTKPPAPHAFGPAHFFGPGPYGRHLFGPPMASHMAGRMGPHMPQARMPRRQNHSFVKIDASSSYGSTYGGAEAFTPCQNPGAFDPAIEVWGYCPTVGATAWRKQAVWLWAVTGTATPAKTSWITWK